MQPDREGENANGERRKHHRAVAEQRLAGKRRKDLGEDAERRQDQDVDFGMTPGPEQVDVHHLVAAGVVGEEMHAEIAVEQQHQESGGQDGKGGANQQTRGQRRPAKHRHAEIGHARGAQFEDRGDDIDATQQRADTRDLQ